MIKKISHWSMLIAMCCLSRQASSKKLEVLPLPLKMTVYSLTMDRAVVLAHKHRPNLESLKYAIKASQYQAKEFLSGNLPHLTLTHQLDQAKGDKSPHSNTTFAARQLVYKFGGPLDLYNLSRKETQVVEFLSDGEKQKVQNEVELSFLDAWFLQQEQEFIKSLYVSTQETFKKAEHQFNVQLLDKKDWLKSSADYAQDVATIGNYDNDTVIAERKLEFLLGQRVSISLNTARYESDSEKQSLTQLHWSPEASINILSLDHYYNQAIKNRPDLAINKKQIEIEHDKVGIARKQNLPWLEVSAQSSHLYHRVAPSGDILRNPSGYHQVSANINWNIFDGALSHFRASKFEATKIKAILETEQTRQKIRIDIEETYYTLSKALVQLQAREIRLAQVKNDLALAKQNLEIGNTSKVELSTALTAWEQEHLAWLSQRVSAEKSYRDLLFACGYPSDLN